MRSEREEDAAAIHALHVAAFPTPMEPAYYQRFGFVAARAFGLHCRWPGTEAAFMVLELRKAALKDARGLVSYHPAFDALE